MKLNNDSQETHETIRNVSRIQKAAVNDYTKLRVLRNALY